MTREAPSIAPGNADGENYSHWNAADWHDGQDSASHRPQINGICAAVPRLLEGRIMNVTTR